jgi:hypothetical protein
MLGGLYRFLHESKPRHFQPMNSNWGLVDPLEERIRNKREKRVALAARALADFVEWLAAVQTAPALPPETLIVPDGRGSGSSRGAPAPAGPGAAASP